MHRRSRSKQQDIRNSVNLPDVFIPFSTVHILLVFSSWCQFMSSMVERMPQTNMRVSMEKKLSQTKVKIQREKDMRGENYGYT